MSRHLCLRTSLCIALWLGVTALSLSPTFATESEQTDHTIGLNEVTQGSFLLKTTQPGRYIPAPTLKTDVKISVTGIIARATVTQEFTNPSREKDDWAEGIYVFPLPETAAVDHLRMKIGERIIEGRIKERGDAKKVYEQAKQEGKRASLIGPPTRRPALL
jgi:Ca-activated chloride channel family protein